MTLLRTCCYSAAAWLSRQACLNSLCKTTSVPKAPPGLAGLGYVVHHIVLSHVRTLQCASLTRILIGDRQCGREFCLQPRSSQLPQYENLALSCLNSIPPTLNFVVVEVKSAAVPGARLSWVAERAGQSSPPGKSRIESRPHPQRRPPISGTSGALIKYACRSDITKDNE